MVSKKKKPFKKSFLILIIILFIITILVGLYSFSSRPQITNNINLKQEDKKSVDSTNLEKPTIEPQKEKVCFENEKYLVIDEGKLTDGGDSVFLIKQKIEKYEFEIKEWAGRCLRLENNFFILDSGCCPGTRGLIIYDLNKRIKIYDGSYDGQVEILNNSISYWEPTSDEVTEKNCPELSKYRSEVEPSSFSIENYSIEAHMKLELTTLKKEWLKEHRCSQTSQ